MRRVQPNATAVRLFEVSDRFAGKMLSDSSTPVSDVNMNTEDVSISNARDRSRIPVAQKCPGRPGDPFSVNRQEKGRLAGGHATPKIVTEIGFPCLSKVALEEHTNLLEHGEPMLGAPLKVGESSAPDGKLRMHYITHIKYGQCDCPQGVHQKSRPKGDCEKKPGLMREPRQSQKTGFPKRALRHCRTD